MNINFSEIELKDLDGKVIPSMEFHKTVANILYHHADSLDFVEVALAMNRGEAVDLSLGQLNDIKKLVNDPKFGVFTYARKAVVDFIDSKNKSKKK